MTAQEEYRRMINECITPALRERGWRGGSSKYYVEGDAGHVGIIELDGNHSRSTAAVRSFNMHVGVASRFQREYLQAIGRPPKSRRPVRALDHDWYDEIASFTISRDDDPLEVGGFVLMIADTQAIPRVLDSLDDEGLRRAVDGSLFGVGNGPARTLLEIALGNFDEATKRIEAFGESFGTDDDTVLYMRRRLRDALSETHDR